MKNDSVDHRARLDRGGLVWESSKKKTSIDKELVTLENYLEKWFEENM